MARPGRSHGRGGGSAGREHLVFFGTSVVSGTGRAVVDGDGRRARPTAPIARRLAERRPAQRLRARRPPLRPADRAGHPAARVGVFAVNVALQRPLLESLLFAIALAVGLTPELLPAIVTLNLSRGAQALASHGVLVQASAGHPEPRQHDGPVHGQDGHADRGPAVARAGDRSGRRGRPRRAGRLAWLNSHFETGFTNPLDAAILAAAPGRPISAAYRKLAELPFDFQRRCLSVDPDRAAGRVAAAHQQGRARGGPRPLDAGPRRRVGTPQPLDAAAAAGRRGTDRRGGGRWVERAIAVGDAGPTAVGPTLGRGR